MDKYTSDNELLFLIGENDEHAFEVLIEKYNQVIQGIVNKYKTKSFNVGLDIKDLYQEGLIGLITAVKTFDNIKEASFKTYANIIIERQIMDMVKTHSRIKYRTLNNAISLDTFNIDEEQSLYTVVERNDTTPEIKLIDKEDRVEIREFLTPFELKVYELKLDGKSNKEIAEILDRSSRSIENTIQRIKLKLKLNV